MPELRLSKLPDRTPVKISIWVTPDLHAALTAYADAYQATYGNTESVAELIPFMLSAFIAGDNGFRKARRGLDAVSNDGGRKASKSRRRGTLGASATPSMAPRDSN